MKIAYLTGRSWRGQPFDGLPPLEAEDRDLLAAAGAPLGLSFAVAFWDEPDLEARGFDAALVRSCWDYTGRAEAFLARMERLDGAVPVLNPPAVLRWNARKTYLQSLAAAGVPTIPTLWADRLTPEIVARAFDAFDAAEIVAKPQVGAGSQRTVRLQRQAWSETDVALGPAGAVMLQPYLAAIESFGELSLFFFGGAFSHAVRKVPAPGGWLANGLDARFAAHEPSPAERAVAEAAVAAMPPGALYARADLVLAGDGLKLIELEAIEPYLMLRHAPQGAANLARALAALR